MIYFGILNYKNPSYKHTSRNIGDYVQTLAALNIYKEYIDSFYNSNTNMRDFVNKIKENRYKDFRFVFLDRDNLSKPLPEEYSDKKIITIMNGWFLHPVNDAGDKISWPPVNNIIPIFISFHIANKKIIAEKYLEYFKEHSPIGCRDVDSMNLLKERGVDAYFSGCLTTTIDFFTHSPEDNGEKVAVDIDKKPGENYVGHYMHQILRNNFFENVNIALDLLERYSKAQSVRTSRLHCYLPCKAMGIPVTMENPEKDKKKEWGPKGRFNGLVYNVKKGITKASALESLRDFAGKDVKKVQEEKKKAEDEKKKAEEEKKKKAEDEKKKAEDEKKKAEEEKKKKAEEEKRKAEEEKKKAEVEKKKAEEEKKKKSEEEKKKVEAEKNKEKNKDIVFCCDENYLKHIPTVINSIKKNSDLIFNIHVISNFKVNDKVEKISEYVKSLGYEFNFYDMSDKKFKYKTNLKHVSVATMLRLLIPDTLSLNVKKVLYLDLDIIINMDLSLIFDLDCGDSGIVAKTSKEKDVIKGMMFNKLSYNYGKSFNAGIMFMDLEKLRKLNFTEECLKILDTHQYNDQVILNLFFKGKYKELPENMNAFNGQDDKKIINKYPNSYIIHYVGSHKPWINGAKCNNIQLWKKYSVNVL